MKNADCQSHNAAIKACIRAAGAVRLPPSLKDNKAYFGSDDGHAYCVDATSGELVWKLTAPLVKYAQSSLPVLISMQ